MEQYHLQHSMIQPDPRGKRDEAGDMSHRVAQKTGTGSSLTKQKSVRQVDKYDADYCRQLKLL